MPSLIDTYQFLGIIGSGNSGTVWLAHQHDLVRDVAIKEFAPALVADPRFLEIFRAEARVMARIDNPHCVSVYDFVEEPGRAWLVCEYVEGPSLRKILDHAGFLTAEQSLGVLKGSLIGLGYGHSLGLVHRDVKPDNVLADRMGMTKVSDFGQALFNPGPGAAGGISTGTPAYMSPEQVGGGPVDYRSDIYSAGAMSFEFLTGRPPFRADSAPALMRMHVNQPVPDPRALNGAIPQGVAGMVMRAMAKDPSERRHTTFEFLDDLERAASAGYGEDWEQRSSIKALVAAVFGAGGVVLPGRTVGAPSIASTAPAAADHEADWWTNKFLVAGAIAGALVLAGGAFALGSGALGRHPKEGMAVASPSPSPSPSASASPTPSPSPEPSPSPVPTAAPAAPAVAGPATMTSPVVWFVDCISPSMQCPGSLKSGAAYKDGTSPLRVDCASKHYLSFYDEYSYSNPGPDAIPVTVSWVGKRPDKGPDAALGTSGEMFSANTTSGQHPVAASTAYLDKGIATQGTNSTLGYIRFKLTWTNPDKQPASAMSDYFYYSCASPTPSP